MFLEELSEKEFDDFSNNHICNSFHQISSWGKLKEKNGWNYHLLGIKEDNEIKCATLLLEKKLMGKYKMFYSPRGYLIDFNDSSLLECFTNHLKNFCKEKNGVFLKLDPYLTYKQRDIDGNVVEGGIDNSKVVDKFKQLGYHHHGFSLQMDDLQPRFAFVLDIKDKTAEEVLKNTESKTRQLIRKNIKNGIYTEEVAVDNIEVFKNIMEHTSKRRNFIDRPFSYYKNMVEVLGENTKILVAKINMNDYLNMLINEVNDLESIILSKENDIANNKKNLNVDKTTKKINECKSNVVRLSSKIDQAREILEKDGEVITLGGIIFMLSGKEVLSLFGGAYSNYMDFISPYTTNWNMIEDAIAKGYHRYSFYGITGDFTNKKSELYGLYDFKRGFGGVVEEYIGEFDLVINKFVYNMYNIAFKVYGKLKKLKG